MSFSFVATFKIWILKKIKQNEIFFGNGSFPLPNFGKQKAFYL